MATSDPDGVSVRSRRPLLVVNAAGLLQGIALVAFPAAATVLTAPSGYALSSGQYGVLFVPQVVLAIAGSLAFPLLAARIGTPRVLLVGLAADVVSMALLVGSTTVSGDAAAFPLLLAATGSLGLGFGLTLSSLSTLAGALHPQRREVALTALNVFLGLGTALSPLLVALFTDVGEWWYLPLVAAVGLVAAAGTAVATDLEPAGASAPPSAPDADGTAPAQGGVPPPFWVFAGALVAYGVCETLFGNWGTTLLTGEGVSATSANYALAAFWAAVTVGRLLISLAPRAFPTLGLYRLLPWCIAGALLATAWLSGHLSGIVLFAAGGLACSGFFPMTLGYAETTFPSHVTLAAGGLVAAYQVGYGIAAFGAGALQPGVSLVTVFVAAAALAGAMGVAALVVARLQRHEGPATPLVARPLA